MSAHFLAVLSVTRFVSEDFITVIDEGLFSTIFHLELGKILDDNSSFCDHKSMISIE